MQNSTVETPQVGALENSTTLTTISLMISLTLAALKTWASLTSGSISVTAEAINNSVDVLTALVAAIVVHWSSRPADATHPYGHGKAESLGALVTVSLLIGTYAVVAYQAVLRCITPQPLRDIGFPMAVIALGVIVNLGRQWAFARAAQRRSSRQLAAEALNFRMDIAASLVTLLAVGVAAFNQGFAQLADPLGALIVAGLALTLAAQVGRQAIDTLLDRAPTMLTETIRQVAQRVPGVMAIHSVRVREVGAECFVDVVAAVTRTMALEAAHDVATAIERQVRQVTPNADVLVHIDPVAAPHESLVDAIHALAARHGYAVHHVGAYTLENAIYAQLDLEVDGQATLDAAHARASDLEACIEHELGIRHVSIHIEPTAAVTQACSPPNPAVLTDCIQLAAVHVPEVRHVHNVRVDQVDDAVLLSLDCWFDPHMSIAAAHEVAEQFEDVLRRYVPSLSRVSIHVEPFGAVDQ
jgi:cation diffusion facilitator family transporter